MHSQETANGWFPTLLNWLSWSRILLSAFVAGCVVGAYVYVFVPVRYSANTIIMVTQSSRQPSTLQQMVGLDMGYSGASVARMVQVLKSRRVRDDLLQKHDLEARLGLGKQDALRWLGGATDVEAIGARGLVGDGFGLRVEVRVAGPSRIAMFRGQKTPFTSAEAKQMCAQLANDYIAALDQYLATSSLKSAQDVYDFVTARIEEVEDSMSETEQSLQELQSEYLLMDPESKTRMVITGAQDAGVEYARTRREAASQASSLNASRALLKKEDAERIAGQVTQRNPMIVNLEQRLASLQGELASEMADGKKSEHPSVVSLEAAIADTREQLDQVAQDVLQQVTQQPNPVYDSLLQDVARLEVQLAGTLARQAQIGQQVQQAEEELRELPTIVREYAYLNRRQAIQGETLTALAREREAAAINLRRESTGSFDVLDAAVPPEKKAGPSSVKAAAVAFVMVMGLLAIGWAYRRGLFTDYDGPLCAGVVGAHGSELPAGEGIDPDSAGGVDGGGKPAP